VIDSESEDKDMQDDVNRKESVWDEFDGMKDEAYSTGNQSG